MDPASLSPLIKKYLSANRTTRPAQVAFYGGSFTSLPMLVQREYLVAVQPFITAGQITGIRLSTRPDCINPEILAQLKEFQVTAVELGVQSMDTTVLALSGRGHSTVDTQNAVDLLKEFGFAIGLQLMVGLPGDSPDTFHRTVTAAIDLKPDFVRIYPLLVIAGTPLAKMYQEGVYAPLQLEDAVVLCQNALKRFRKAEIEVIRIGLQSTEELEKPGTVLAGPYHPAFRQLVESAVMLDLMRVALRARIEKSDCAVFHVTPADVSTAIGQQKSNIARLKQEFGLRSVRIEADKALPAGQAQLYAQQNTGAMREMPID